MRQKGRCPAAATRLGLIDPINPFEESRTMLRCIAVAGVATLMVAGAALIPMAALADGGSGGLDG